MAENMLIKMPMLKVTAKPLTTLVVKPIKIKQVIRVETLPSKIEGQARRKLSAKAMVNGFSCFNSSFNLSKIKILASTAIPRDRMKPAIPAKVKVTGINLKTAKDNNP